MPSKKIKVIALDTPAAEEPVTDSTATEAEGLNDVINDIQAESSSLDESTVEVPLPEEPEAKPAAKKKARAPKKSNEDLG